MKVPYLDLPGQHEPLKQEILSVVEGILDSGQFILGQPVSSFEEEFANLCNSKYAVGVSDGTDALVLSMKALGIGKGDEVITVPNSFLASGTSIALTGADPVFVDVLEDMTMDPGSLETRIGPRTKAIMPVHLTGLPANMDEINRIAEKNGLFVIEDAAQAVRAEYKGSRVGSLGTMGCFSLHPLKNLNACGDGGVITTNDKELYEFLLKARNHGLKNRDECAFISSNARLDSLQAEILKVKMKYLPKWEKRRREIAGKYQDSLKDLVRVPIDGEDRKGVYHTFVLQCSKRDELMEFLKERGIDTKVHYPIPIHLQEPFRKLGFRKGNFPKTEEQAEKILSLPVYPELRDEQIEYICEMIREFYS